MNVQNLTNSRGNKVPNQFIITEHNKRTFQSYDSVICVEEYTANGREVTLDENTWDYSVTTSRHRGTFLGENTATTRKKIKSGEYKLANLN